MPTKKTDPVVRAFERWRSTVVESYEAVSEALSEKDYERAAEIMTAITQQQAKMSLQLRQETRPE